MKKIFWIGAGLVVCTSFSAQEMKPAVAETVAPVQPVVPPASAASEAPESFRSPYKEKGLPADAMRTMLLDPDLAAQVKNNKQLWIGDIMRIGAYTRPRAEFRGNLNFSQGNTENISRFTQQSQVFFFINPTRDAELKITLQDARVWGGDGGVKTGDDRAFFFNNGDYNAAGGAPRGWFDVREAYLQFRNVGVSGLGVQVGRQVLAYGDGRMIGSANWTFGGLSYDGVTFKYDNDWLSSHLFGVKGASSPTNNMPNGGTSNTSNAQGDVYLAGLYNTVKMGFAALDLYAIGMFRNTGVDCVNLGATSVTSGTSTCGVTGDIVGSASYSPAASLASTQRANIYTFGTRLTNRTDNNKLPLGHKWDYTLEAAIQAGNASDLIYADGTGAVTAVSRTYAGQLFYAQTGYKVLDDLRLGAHAFYSPGTANRTGSTINTFQTLPGPRFGTYPYLNNFNGISENMGMKNIFTPSVSLTYESKKWGDFTLSYFYEMKATNQDAWYGISGVANSSTSGTAGRTSTESASNSSGANLGSGLYQEVDFVWMQRFTNYFSIWIGAGYLHAGNAISIARGADFKADGFMSFIQLQGAL